MAQRIRDGRGKTAYKRKREALKRRVARDGLTCGHGSPTQQGCGQPFDLTLPAGHPQAFTADHPEPLNHGGHLVAQVLVPMHNSCNSRKGDSMPVEVWAAT